MIGTLHRPRPCYLQSEPGCAMDVHQDVQNCDVIRIARSCENDEHILTAFDANGDGLKGRRRRSLVHPRTVLRMHVRPGAALGTDRAQWGFADVPLDMGCRRSL